MNSLSVSSTFTRRAFLAATAAAACFAVSGDGGTRSGSADLKDLEEETLPALLRIPRDRVESGPKQMASLDSNHRILSYFFRALDPIRDQGGSTLSEKLDGLYQALLKLEDEEERRLDDLDDKRNTAAFSKAVADFDDWKRLNDPSTVERRLVHELIGESSDFVRLSDWANSFCCYEYLFRLLRREPESNYISPHTTTPIDALNDMGYSQVTRPQEFDVVLYAHSPDEASAGAEPTPCHWGMIRAQRVVSKDLALRFIYHHKIDVVPNFYDQILFFRKADVRLRDPLNLPFPELPDWPGARWVQRGYCVVPEDAA